MIILAIQHRVEDYETWKAVFDTLPPTSLGASFHRLNRGADDPNNVVVVSGWTSIEAARAFTKKPELAEGMKDAGVIGPPRFEYYEEVEAVQA